MGKLERIQEYFINQNVDVNLWQFSADILLTICCAVLLSNIYNVFSKSLSNKRAFSANFVTLALTTMMIITIIKSSVALSLGLVGALSIVRFRAAIKDPEELVYIFLCISLGLGFGSGHRYVTLLYFAAICLVIVIKSRAKKAVTDSGIFLSVSGTSLNFSELTELIKASCEFLELNRVDINKNDIDGYFMLKTNNEAAVQKIINDIKAKDSECALSFTHNKGLLS